MTSGALTVVVILVIKALNAVKSHWQASASAAFALCAVAVIAFCAVGHKFRQETEPADDDDDALVKDGKQGRPSLDGVEVAAHAGPREAWF